jgi:hypothetical protein
MSENMSFHLIGVGLAREGIIPYSDAVKEDELLPAMQPALPGNVSIVHK